MTKPMPPGWYDDPDGSPNAERRWDGHNWTPERRRKATHIPASSYPPPGPAQASPYQQPAPPPSYQQPFQAPPPPQPAPPPHYQASSYPQTVPPPYMQPPYLPPGPTQPNQTASNLFSIIAFVCAGLAVLFLPVVFGPAGIILGVVGLTKKERLAPFAIGAAIGGLILGWWIEAVLWSAGFY